jgi:hypothetical protein
LKHSGHALYLKGKGRRKIKADNRERVEICEGSFLRLRSKGERQNVRGKPWKTKEKDDGGREEG